MRPNQWNDVRELALHVNEWANRTFPGRPAKASLTKLVMEEIPELLTHLKEQGPVGIGGELADCFILLLDLAEMWGVDLPNAIKTKMEVNERRMWRKDPDTGHYNHVTLTTEVDFSGAERNDQR